MMKRRIRLLPLLLAAAIVFGGRALHADDRILARGFEPNSAYHMGEFDSVNVFNGNLTVRVPLGQPYTTNGTLQYQFGVVYNSHLWDYYEWSVIGTIQYSIHLMTRYHRMIQITPADLPTAGGETGVESVPFGNAGIGWNFSLGDLRGSANGLVYVGPDGSEVLFGKSMHGPDPTGSTVVYYSIGQPVLRMRDLTTDGGPPLREVDFPDGTRKRYTCVKDCSGTFAELAQWNLEWIADPYGNVLRIARKVGTTDQPTPPTSGTWTWRFEEGRLPFDAGRLDPYYNGSGEDDKNLEIVREHVAEFAISHAPWEYRLERLDLAAYSPSDAAARRAVYVLDYGSEDRIYRDTVIPWSNPTLRVPYATADGKIAVSMLKAIKLPGSGDGGPADTGSGSGSMGKWSFSYYSGAEEPLSSMTVGSNTYKTSFVAGRVKTVTPPTCSSCGYRYTYERRGYARAPCHVLNPLHFEDRPALFTGVRTRQQLDVSGAPAGTPWLYTGSGFRLPTSAGDCTNRKEFVASVIDPFGKISMSFFSLDLAEAAVTDFLKPFSRVESDSVPRDGTVRFLSTRLFQADSYSTFAANPASTIFDMLDVYRANPSSPQVPGYGKVLRSTYTLYDVSHSFERSDVPGDYGHKHLRLQSEHTRYHDDTEHPNQPFIEVVRSDYDGLGHYRRTDTYGNFRDLKLGGGIEHRTEYTWFNDDVVYQPGQVLPTNAPAFEEPWLLDTYVSTTVLENTFAVHARYTFDAQTGFLQEKRAVTGTAIIVQKNGEPDPHLQVETGAGDLLTTYERTEDSDGEGPTTKVVESHYGGDSAAKDAEYVTEHIYQFGSIKQREVKDCSNATFLFAERNAVDPSTGLARSSTDSGGVVTTFDYDRMGRPAKVKPQNEASQTYGYKFVSSEPASAANELTITRTPIDPNLIPPRIVYTYDHFGRTQKTSRNLPSGTNQTNHTYDLLGRMLTQSVTADGALSAAGLWTTRFTYDTFDRVTETKRPDGTKTTVEYIGGKGVNRKTSDVQLLTGQSTVIHFEAYDSFGRTVRVNDNAVRADYDYDPAGHLTSAELHTVGGSLNQKRKFDYDGRGLLTHERHPELLIPTSDTTYTELRHEYDSLGNQIRLRYAGPNASAGKFDLDFDYDKAGRLVRVTHPHRPAGSTESPILRQFKYHPQATNGTAAGRLHVAQRYNYVPDPAGTNNTLTIEVKRELVYDAAGRPQTVKLSVPYSGLSTTTTYGYGELGELSTIQYPAPGAPMSVTTNTRVVANRFQHGFLTRVEHGLSAAALTTLATLAYHPTELVREVCFPNAQGTACTSRDVIGADPRGMSRPRNIEWKYSNGDVSKGTGDYAYDGAGNISGIGPDDYAYDTALRLVQAKFGTTLTQNYSYDAFGNLTQLGPRSIGVNSLRNRVSTYVYDDAGNVITMPDKRPLVEASNPNATLSFTYDYSGALVHYAATGIRRSFVYDDQDERVGTLDASVAASTRELWSVRGLDHRVLRDFDRASGSWIWKKDYLYRGSLLLGTISGTPSAEVLRQVHLDHLGTVRLVTTATGDPVDGTSPQKYWPFGEPLIPTPDPFHERMVFTGHERDDDGTNAIEADVDYMHARYYSPVGGRFLSVDPSRVQRPGLPQSWNRYSYSIGNPIRLVDPNGQDSREAVENKPSYADKVEAFTNSVAAFVVFSKLNTNEGVFTAALGLQSGSNERFVKAANLLFKPFGYTLDLPKPFILKTGDIPPSLQVPFQTGRVVGNAAMRYAVRIPVNFFTEELADTAKEFVDLCGMLAAGAGGNKNITMDMIWRQLDKFAQPSPEFSIKLWALMSPFYAGSGDSSASKKRQ